MSTKIQSLIQSWPPNAVRTVGALKKKGFSQSLLTSYRDSGWLTSLGDGALYRSGDEPKLIGATYALTEEHSKFHVGGLTALELQGRAHFLRGERNTFWIFGEKKRLPKWFTNHTWEADVLYSSAVVFKGLKGNFFTDYSDGEITVQISNELRAVFELLTFVPERVGLDEAREIVASLTSSHPEKVKELLRAGTSIKAKRLFLALSDLASHSWMRTLNLDGVDLGTGPRNLVREGTMHKRFQITLPASFFSDAEK